MKGTIMEIITFVEPAKVNPYAEDVAALIVATDADENAAAAYVIPTDDAGKERLKFSKAANDADKTALLKLSEDLGDGTTRLVFKLTKKHNRSARKPRGDKATETAETVEAAPEAVEEVPAEVYADTDSIHKEAVNETHARKRR